jgi:hypothetical protein
MDLIFSKKSCAVLEVGLCVKFDGQFWFEQEISKQIRPKHLNMQMLTAIQNLTTQNTRQDQEQELNGTGSNQEGIVIVWEC